MIHYAIQSHGRRLDRVIWLLRQLDHPHVSLSVWHDGLEALAARPVNDVHRARRLAWYSSGSLTYWGYSLVTALLNAMRHALETDPGWRWFINLSGSCVPLTSQARILQFLESRAKAGIFNHAFTFQVKRKTPDLLLPGYDDLNYERVPVNRPVVYCERRCAYLFGESVLNPVFHPAMRVNLHSVEVLGLRTLFVRPLLATERLERQDFFGQHRHYAGRAWYILHRDTCEQLIGSLCRIDSPFRTVFSSCFVPDESMIATWLNSEASVRQHSVLNNNLRLDMATPRTLTDADLPRLQATDALFARKLSPDAAATHAWIERRIAED